MMFIKDVTRTHFDCRLGTFLLQAFPTIFFSKKMSPKAQFSATGVTSRHLEKITKILCSSGGGGGAGVGDVGGGGWVCQHIDIMALHFS